LDRSGVSEHVRVEKNADAEIARVESSGDDRHDLGVVGSVAGSVEGAVSVCAIDDIGLSAAGDFIDGEVDVISGIDRGTGVEASRSVAFEFCGVNGLSICQSFRWCGRWFGNGYLGRQRLEWDWRCILDACLSNGCIR